MSKTDRTQNAQRFTANQIYVRMLVKRSDLIPKINTVDFGTALPGDTNVGSVVHAEDGGTVFFNEDGAGVFILLAGDEIEGDNE